MPTRGVVDVKANVAHARRWHSPSGGGWELHVDGIGVTQVHEIGQTKGQVLDSVETITGKTVSLDRIVVFVDHVGP